MIQISGQNIYQKPSNQIPPNFKSKESSLSGTLSKKEKLYYGFIKQRESLATSRFVQDVTTNWLPKVVFARSLADFTEMTFLEYTESALFYFAPMLLNSAFGKIFSKFSPKELRKDVGNHIAKPTEDLLNASKLAQNNILKRAIPAKAAIVLACVSIPAGEYALSFAKNLLTLKLFKKSDFNNIANLNTTDQQTESEAHQEKVRNSANRHIKLATEISGAALAGSFALAVFGHKSEALQKISKGILRPGLVISHVLEKFGIKSESLNKNLNKYINFDCDIKEGKPLLSKGQLVVSTNVGLLGYSAAGEDRGKLDQLEVLTRVPVVVLYTIFGSEAFDWAYKHILLQKNKYPDLIKKLPNSSKIADIPDSKEIEEIAKKIAKEKNTSVQKEFNRLVKEKAAISAIPYGFSLIFMGFLLAGITRFWTQYRYDHGKGQSLNNSNSNQAKIKTNEAINQNEDKQETQKININRFSWMP